MVTRRENSVTANYRWRESANPGSLAESLAKDLVTQIGASIANKGSAVIAVSGGSTPKPLFNALATLDVDWSKVSVTLVDERWVDSSHELSNQAFLKRHLLDGLANDVTFIPLYQAAESASQSLALVLSEYCEKTHSSIGKPREFDAVVLGMGGDGHTASFFPDASNIAAMLDPGATESLYSCHSPSTQVDRVTWSLPMLLNTSFLALHVTGLEKKAVFDRAAENGASLKQQCQLPIRSVIFQNSTPLNVYYAD